MKLRSRRGRRRRIVQITALCIMCIVLQALGPCSSLASATQWIEGSQAKGSAVRIKQSLVPLGSCPSKDVVMRVAVSRSSYAPSQPVDILAVVRNIGKTVCTYGGTGGGNQYIGPCGAFSMTVLNSRGLNIWPGPIAYSCPMIGPTHLAPGGQMIATGTWPKLMVVRRGTSAAPPGRYQLNIARRVMLTIMLK